MTTIADTTSVNGDEGVDSPVDFLEYKIANWLWLYVAPGLLIMGLAGNRGVKNVNIEFIMF